MKTQPYFYTRQIERFLIQFANVFSGFQVPVGIGDKQQMVSVPIIYGSIDKVTASLYSGATQNKPIRLPMLSTHMSGLELASELYSGVGQEDRFSYLPSGGILPDDIRVLRRYRPIPYRVATEVYLYSSNEVQQLQLLEQILILFDPSLVIQTSDARFDWTKLTSVTLEDISLDEPIPIGDSDRMITSKLSFKFPIWITPPAKDKRNDFVEKIRIRIRDMDELLATQSASDFFDPDFVSPGREFGLQSVINETLFGQDPV